MGKIVADLPGDVQLRYDDGEVQPGQQLSTWLKWVGDQDGGNLHIEGGLEFGAMWKVVVDLPWPLPDINDSGNIPLVPSVDLGFFRDCGFTPFLLNNSLSCSDPLYPSDIDIVCVGFPGIADLCVGVNVGGDVTGNLSGNSVCANNSYCISSDGQQRQFPVSLSSCNTTVGVANSYRSDFRLNWGVELTPYGCLEIFVLPDICLDPFTKDFTIFNQYLPLDFNRPDVQFQIEGQEPPRPDWCDATDDRCNLIEVCWDNVPGEDGYRVYRDGSQIGSTGANQTCYPDNVTGTHSYCVKAYNSCGQSSCSPSDNGTGLTAPPRPDWCDAKDDRCNLIEVCWDNVPGEDGYRVYRDGSQIGSTGANQTCYPDNVTGTHSYCVKAYNSCGQSSCSPSDIGTGMTAPPAPGTPSASTTTPCSDTVFEISWESVSGATEYRLYENGTQVYEGSDRTWDALHHANMYEQYEFYVKAGNPCGWSSPSGKEEVTIQPVPSRPDSIYFSDEPIQLNVPCTLSWAPIDHATLYRLEDRGAVLHQGADTSKIITHTEKADYVYTLVACSPCGCSDPYTRDIETDVLEVFSDVLPVTFSLSQNYPNPFNMETRIQFALPRASHVSMDVYNVLGNRVKRIVDERLSVGHKLVTWDGCDESGRPVSSGVYFYRMVAGDFAETKKLVLLK
ncbi:MAG: T9SS type A sorting domain-containing protein [candidate division Zixibacteria bacterium]|nr:T9SS type A sorting domain-containing protein [candidate division Zixibacteria bacterium]